MARIAFVGLGKLGFPLAVAWALKGHQVTGYDLDASVMHLGPRPYHEAGPDGTGRLDALLATCGLQFAPSLQEAVHDAEIIFLAIQTPHRPEFEGITPRPATPEDFDYTALCAAVEALRPLVRRPTVLAILSTVLPGTLRRRILPCLSPALRLVYTPQFVAMGTVLRDFVASEFYLVGVDHPLAAQTMTTLYGTINPCTPVQQMSLESAEVCKVTYNVAIGMKIMLAQTLLEIATKIPEVDVDDVTETLQKATTRLVSPRYMTAGGLDGGPCHPRDLNALSHLARTLPLSYDIFDTIATVRERQAQWLASLVIAYHDQCFPHRSTIILLGVSFKKESNLTTGSGALLCQYYLIQAGYTVQVHDPYVYPIQRDWVLERPTTVLVGTAHAIFQRYVLEGAFPRGTLIIDPYRYLPDADGLTVVRLGEAPLCTY
jgi:UDPglucose 6-dehydrogenase